MSGVHKSLGDQVLHGDSFKYRSDNQIEKTEMGRTCNTYRGLEKLIQTVAGET